MTQLVGYLLLFVGVGVIFLFFHLMMGKLVRPNKPDADKLTIYECGEPTIGSAWIQFDLRFYVVALLFVIFDVEVAFFFPWAVVFGQANALASPRLSDKERMAQAAELDPGIRDSENQILEQKNQLSREPNAKDRADRSRYLDDRLKKLHKDIPVAAHSLAWFAFWDILVFFGVLLVGFAYLWRRGDLDWVRSTAAEKSAAPPPPAAGGKTDAELLVGAGRGS